MNIQLPNGASGFYPAPTNHIVGDPTPMDQAVYIPSVSPGYAKDVYAQDWKRSMPEGVGTGDLNFLDPDNKLFRISHFMSSAGQALDQTQPCIIRNRDRSQTMMISDSGGYQIAGGHMVIQNTADILRILRWQEQYADWSMTLDVPTVNVGKPGFKYSTFRACLDQTVDYLNFYATNRKHGATKFLNVLQGNNLGEADTWYNAVKHFPFEGWAFGGVLRNNFYHLCRRIIKMQQDGVIQDRDWIHVLGTNQLETAVGLTALQRAINKYINPRLRISYDTSSPFRMLRWHQAYSLVKFDGKKMTLSSEVCPDARVFVDSAIRFPWPSPLGDRMVMGDLCVKTGANHHVYRDNQANHYLVNHNLASLCTAVAQANRIFDAEAILGKHTIAVPMARAIASIDAVIKAGTLTELNRHQAVFNAVKTVFDDADPDIDRAEI